MYTEAYQTFMYIHTYTHTHTCIHACIHIHTYTHTHIHIHTYTDIHVHTHIHIHRHTYTYTHTHIHTYTYTHTHIHTYTHTYTQTFMYPHTYTHTHTDVFNSLIYSRPVVSSYRYATCRQVLCIFLPMAMLGFLQGSASASASMPATPMGSDPQRPVILPSLFHIRIFFGVFLHVHIFFLSSSLCLLHYSCFSYHLFFGLCIITYLMSVWSPIFL